jgi:predicted ATPase
MELVYLWVEDYKNIKSQGFNFSPRFRCEYNEDTKELTINENKEYVSIFPDNINVTAIVGENGSGKSSIIKFIEKLFINADIEKKFILLLFINNEFKIQSNNVLKKVINTSIFVHSILNTNLFSLFTYYSEMPYPYDERQKLHVKKFNHYGTINMQQRHIYKLMAELLQTKNTVILDKLKFIFTPTKMEVSTNNEYKNNLISYIHNHLNEDLSFKNKNVNSFLQQKILPSKTKLIDNIIHEVYINGGRYDDFLDQKAEDEFNSNKEFYKSNWEEDDYPMSDDDIISELSMQFIDQFPAKDFIESTFNQNEIYQWLLKELNLKLYSFFDGRVFGKQNNPQASKLNIFAIFLFYTILENNLLEEYLEFIIENYFQFNTHIESVDSLIEFSFEDTELDKISNFIKTHHHDFDYSYIYFKQLLSTNSNKIDYFNQYYDLFLFDFIDENNRMFSSLSHGEKTFFGQVISIYHYSLNTKHSNLLFCFDEPEISLHVKWQQLYIEHLLHAINQINKRVSLIFTSHSPFLLSDLPKENVIFLEKGKQVDPKIETFGANIHTLLSHGFFMKDGLMGEFAKEKINKAITHLNQKTLTEHEIDYCENIISIIGEPILKRQLQKMLDSKRLNNIDDIDKKIKDMEYELSVLKKYQKKATTDELKDRAKRKYSKKKKDDKNN